MSLGVRDAKKLCNYISGSEEEHTFRVAISLFFKSPEVDSCALSHFPLRLRQNELCENMRL